MGGREPYVIEFSASDINIMGNCQIYYLDGSQNARIELVLKEITSVMTEAINPRNWTTDRNRRTITHRTTTNHVTNQNQLYHVPAANIFVKWHKILCTI